jgi:metal-dependent amidase/aminoacylase/carboxypeptidase family protein
VASLTVHMGYKDLINNLALARRFGEHLGTLGRRPAETDASVGAGSTDMGDISHAVPSIHPWLAICEKNETTCHQHAFAACAAGERGAQAMLAAAKAMALTAADLLTDGALREAARKEHDSA